MVCPIWNGIDTAGREVCPDSFMTKRAGCNSADDRVIVENNLRPQYAEYINLNTAGFNGNQFGGAGSEGYKYTSAHVDAGLNAKTIHNVHNYTGQFGEQFESSRQVSCQARGPTIDAYNEAMSQQKMAQQAQGSRQQGAMNNMYHSNQRMNDAGMGM